MGGPGLHVQSLLWDSAVLKQWSAAITTPSLRAAHMGLAAPQDMGTEFIQSVLSESKEVWLAHARACSGPGGTMAWAMAWALQELQPHQQVERQGVSSVGRPRIEVAVRREARAHRLRCATHYTQHGSDTQPCRFVFSRVQDIPAIAIWQQPSWWGGSTCDGSPGAAAGHW